MRTKNILVYFIILSISLFQIQCKSTQNQTSQYKAVYIDQFKLTYFRNVLIKGYNNSKALHEIINEDHSGFTEPILTDADYQLIDSLTTVANLEMKIDSMEGYQRSEGSKGKRPLGYILKKLDSKWLDSVARKRLKLSGVPESWNR